MLSFFVASRTKRCCLGFVFILRARLSKQDSRSAGQLAAAVSFLECRLPLTRQPLSFGNLRWGHLGGNTVALT
jgi:hypothetical protein